MLIRISDITILSSFSLILYKIIITYGLRFLAPKLCICIKEIPVSARKKAEPEDVEMHRLNFLSLFFNVNCLFNLDEQAEVLWTRQEENL